MGLGVSEDFGRTKEKKPQLINTIHLEYRDSSISFSGTIGLLSRHKKMVFTMPNIQNDENVIK